MKLLHQAYELREKIIGQAEKNPPHLCNFALLFEDGTEKTFLNQACYAQLPSTSGIHNKAAYFIDWSLARWGNKKFICSKTTEEMNKEFIDWVINRSHFRINFLTRNVDDIIKNGAILSTKQPLKFVLMGCMLIRMTVEPQPIIYNWKQLCKYMEPHAALIFAHYIGFLDEFHFHPWNSISGHSIIEYGLTQGGLRNFLSNNKQFFNKEKPMSVNFSKYRHLFSIWTDELSANLRINTPFAPKIQNKDNWGVIHNKYKITYLKNYCKALLKSSNCEEWSKNEESIYSGWWLCLCKHVQRFQLGSMRLYSRCRSRAIHWRRGH